LGRLFTAPTRDNRQVDIVIAITPRVIRAPAILPEDEIEQPSGTLSTPTSGSLEAMLIQDEIDEQLAAARRLGNTAQVQLPDQKPEEMPTYIPTNPAQTSSLSGNQTTEASKNQNNTVNIRPIDATNLKTLSVTPTSDSTENTSRKESENNSPDLVSGSMTLPLTPLSQKVSENESSNNSMTAQVQFLPNLPEMKTGEKTKIAVLVRSANAFRSAVLGLKFDAQKLAVRAVTFGDVFGADLAGKAVSPFLNQNGKTYVSLSAPKDTAENSSGILAYLEIEALQEGKHEISFDSEIMTILTADGKNLSVRF
jgi:hypothetical protein